MDYKVVLMKDAEEDLDRFITYLLLEKKSEQAARNLLNDFEATKISLSNVAGSLKLCDNLKLRNQDIEESIFYRIDILCFIVLKGFDFSATLGDDFKIAKDKETQKECVEIKLQGIQLRLRNRYF